MTISSRTWLLLTIRGALYALVAFVPLVFYQQIMHPFIIPKTALFQALTLVIAGGWFVLAVRDRRYRPRPTPLVLGGAFYLGILALASLAGTDWRLALWSYPERSFGLIALGHLGLLTLALTSLRNAISWRRLALLSLGTSAVVALATLVAAPEVSHFFLDTGTARPGSFFGNPTFVAGYLLAHMFLALGFAGRAEGRSSRLGFGFLALVLASAVFRTQTRGDILGLLLGLFIAVVVFALRRFRPFTVRHSLATNGWFIALVLGAALIGGFALTRGAPVWQRVPGAARFTTDAAIGGDLRNRLYAWSAGWKAFQDRPILGYGWENFYIAFSHYYDPRLLGKNFSETSWDKPHNTFLEHAISGGAFGLLAYLGVIAAAAYEGFRSRAPFTDIALGAGAMGAYLVRSAVIFDTIGTYLVIALALAAIDLRYRIARGEAEEPLLAESPSASTRGALAPAVLVAAILAAGALNVPTVRGALAHYEGVNFYVGGRLLEQSAESFRRAIAANSPYADQIQLDFANTVKQAYDSNAAYPDLKNLHAELVGRLRGIIARHPQNFFYYSALAEFESTFSVFDESYLDDAERLLARSLELSPNRQQAYYILAKNRLRRGDISGAREAFETAIRLYPEAGDPHFYYALVLYEAGDAARGKAELALAEKLGRVPRTVPEAVTVGDFVGDASGDYAGAAGYYRLALTYLGGANPDQAARITLKMGIAQYMGNDFPGAAESFRAAASALDLTTLPIYPSLAPVLRGLGVTLPAKATAP